MLDEQEVAELSHALAAITTSDFEKRFDVKKCKMSTLSISKKLKTSGPFFLDCLMQ